jgi:site-specific recombinase XerD
MKDAESLESYLREQYTDQSVKSYLITIDNFLCSNPKAMEYTYKDIVVYLDGLKKVYQNDGTRSTQLAAIKKYYDFLLETKQRDDHPCRALYIRVQKNSIELQRLFSSQELELLLQRENRYRLLNLRNKVLISILIYQGLRSEEVCNVRMQDVDLENGFIVIRSTHVTNRRVMELKPKQILLINNYLTESRPKLLKTDTDKLLITKKGIAICVDTINRMIRPLQGLFSDRILNASTIRQSVIRNWLNEKKYPLADVQLLAGHKYPSSTEKYLQEDTDDRRKLINQFHPLG